METSNNCEYDSLEVYNGATKEPRNRVAKLCGSQIPDPIMSTGNEMILRFHSDFSVAFKGFKLQFASTGIMFFWDFFKIIFLMTYDQLRKIATRHFKHVGFEQ